MSELLLPKKPILIGNISGSTGDRLDGLKHMLSGSTKVDAITGDWLSEFNLASRGLQKETNPQGGYEPGFLYSLRLAVDEYLAYPNQHLKIVVNAGGLNARELAVKVQELLRSRNSSRKIAYITGDNVLDRVDSLGIQPLTRSTGDFGSWRQKHGRVVTANVYIGCWGIVRALDDGADIVICGRCTDASPVLGLAAWWHRWKQDDFNKLAGALVAGHLIECGCYVTGGNFGGFQQMGRNHHTLSYPIAEILADGTSIVQKQPNQNGIMNMDTTRTQFLYELQGIYYYNPDVIGNLANVQMEQAGVGRVRVSGAQGLPAPETLKIAVMAVAGYSAEFLVYLTGPDVRAKAEDFKSQSLRMLDESEFQALDFQVFGTPQDNPRSQLESTVVLRVFAQAKEPGPLKRGRFLGPLLSNQLQGYPGLTPNLDYRTSDPRPYMTYFPGVLPLSKVQQRVHTLLSNADRIDTTSAEDKYVDVPNAKIITPFTDLPREALEQDVPEHRLVSDFGPTETIPLGDLVYARSGDKGSNVNVGLFFPSGKNSGEKWEWLRSFLTKAKFCELLGDDHKPGSFIDRCEFPNIQAVHFVIHGRLGQEGGGVSSTSNADALGKNLGEYLRAKHVEMPKQFMEAKSRL